MKHELSIVDLRGQMLQNDSTFFNFLKMTPEVGSTHRDTPLM